MTRVGLLPLEIEDGRCRSIPREERLCKFNREMIGDVSHFLNGCAALTIVTVPSLEWHSVALANTIARIRFGARRRASSSADRVSEHRQSKAYNRSPKIQQMHKMRHLLDVD